MVKNSFLMLDGKIVLWLHDRVCEDANALLSSDQFCKFLTRCIFELKKKKSRLINIFGTENITENDIEKLISTLSFLTRLPAAHVEKLVEGSAVFFKDKDLFNSFVEYLYNYWRHFKRLIISQTDDDEVDIRPNRRFNRTIEHLTSLVRSTYRDIQVSITGNYPRIYRQVSAGAELSAITKVKTLDLPEAYKKKVENIGVIRQVLMYPPLIFNSECNKRTGEFERVNINPISNISIDTNNWLCYPAMVGPLLILVYFNINHFELNFSLCNLFELAVGSDLHRKADAILFFGVNEKDLEEQSRRKAFFYDDEENDLIVGFVPDHESFGYFGYLKKLILTLHNIKMMKKGSLPFHGAMFQLKLNNIREKNILVIGDTGAGKSETLEAFRAIASNEIEDIQIISDDMGSLSINTHGEIIGYGTEIGAFVRLDDLQPGYAFGQMDRAIIINANQVNARVVIPVTNYNTIMQGHKVDYVLYANNYETLGSNDTAIRQIKTHTDALRIFRDGKVMSKGTTSSTGMVGSYFANIFGPSQYPHLHEVLAEQFFKKMEENGIFIGEILTQLGVTGMERNGPMIAAKNLLKIIRADNH